MIAANRASKPAISATSASPLPSPLLSSGSRGWNGIVVELHHFRGIDAIVPMHDHVVGVHVAGSVNLLQSRNGRSTVKHLRAGDVTVTPSGEPKRFQHSGENIVILLKVAPALLERVACEECVGNCPRFDLREDFGTADPRLVVLGKGILASLESEGTIGSTRAESLATDVATHLLRHYCTASLPDPKPVPKLSQRKLQRALEYIDSNLREDISIADIARMLSISRGHFAHAFRQTTGLSPHRFVLARRLEHAKGLLRETDLPITEIAHRIGCASHSHFSVLFHRATGQTPRDYRNQS